MLRQEKKEINGHTYTVTQFTASEGFPLMIKLKNIEDGLMENITEILKIFSKTTREDEVINSNNFDRFFNDDYEALKELMEFVITFNFLQKKGTGNLSKKPV